MQTHMNMNIDIHMSMHMHMQIHMDMSMHRNTFVELAIPLPVFPIPPGTRERAWDSTAKRALLEGSRVY